MSQIVCNNAEFVAGWVSGHFPHGVLFKDFYAVGLVSRGRIVAGCVFDKIADGAAHVHLVVEGRISASFLAACHDLAFSHLGLLKAIGCTGSSNEKSIRLMRKVGFAEVRREPRAYFGGEDMVVFEQTKRSGARWLNSKY